MSVKGKQREQTEFKKELFIGFTSVQVVAFNPSREELDTLLGREAKDGDEPIEYVGVDKDGNERVRMAFWLKDSVKDKFFAYSFNITKKERKNKDEDKVQLINSTCGTTWVPFVEGTDQPNEALIQPWFKEFQTKEKEVLGQKKWRKALSGEEELGILIRAWLGRMNFNDPETEVFIDTDKLFKGKWDEICSLINGDYDTPFVCLLGVKTDEVDTNKKYQQVYGKQFLQDGFLKYIQNGKFPSDYTKKVWKKFEEEVNGEYGFKCFFELVPIKEYNEAEDIAASSSTKTPEPSSSDY